MAPPYGIRIEFSMACPEFSIKSEAPDPGFDASYGIIAATARIRSARFPTAPM
jgi:hypothetical protein